MSENYYKFFDKEKYNKVKANLSGYRLDNFIREVEKRKGENKGLIFPFARGLRFSASLIYAIRDCLAGSNLEVNWGQLIDEDGMYCSPECDIIIHKKGHYAKWNGTDQGHHIMDFRFIEQKNALAVISCKSYLTKSTIEVEYCKNMLALVNKVWLFSECIGPESKDIIKEEATNIGYENFWYLYTWNRNTGESEDNIDGWYTFIEAVKSLL
jgi:hypothetical protein